MKCSKCGEDAGTKAVCPGCGIIQPAAGRTENGASCSRCNVPRIPVKKKSAISAAGLLGVAGFLIGLLLLLVNAIAGLLVIIISIIIGMARPEYTIMVCPNCGHQGRKL